MASQAWAAAAMRRRWRWLTASAASSSRAQPLTTSRTAARVSAESPRRNAARRCGLGPKFRGRTEIGRSIRRVMPAAFSKGERLPIELAPGTPGQRRDLGHRVLHRSAGERIAQQIAGLGGLGIAGLALRRRDHERNLAALLAGMLIVPRKGREIAATDFLVEFRELATHGRPPRAET